MKEMNLHFFNKKIHFKMNSLYFNPKNCLYTYIRRRKPLYEVIDRSIIITHVTFFKYTLITIPYWDVCLIR